MAEREEVYLRQCLERNVCSYCGGLLFEGKRVGMGQFKDGIFCNLSCQAEHYKLEYVRKLALMQKRPQKDG